MSHNYLLDLNRYIEARIASLQAAAPEALEAPHVRRQHEGRMAALAAFQSLLCREYYPKLPRRLYHRFSQGACGIPASVSDSRPIVTGDRQG